MCITLTSRFNRPVANAATASAEQAGERGPYARGVRKKQALVQAVLRLLAREGMGAITHRAVAAEAGTSLRSTTYYFTTKEDITAAVRLIVDQVAAESEDPDTSWAAEFELVLSVARDPALAPEYLDFQVKLEGRIRLMMKELGSPHPARDARIVLGFLRGFELEQLSRPDRPLSKRALVADLTRLLKALCAAG